MIKNESQMSVLQEVALFGLIGIIVFVGFSVLNLGIAVLIALLFVFYRLAPRVTGLNSRRQQLVASLAALEKARIVLEEQTKSCIRNGTIAFQGLETSIELDNVEFGYEVGNDVVNGISLSINRGEMTAIVGASGSGKSTLLNLLLRLYDPTRGSISVDEVDLTNLDLTTWRRSIGVVSQDVFLFNDTIFNHTINGS